MARRATDHLIDDEPTALPPLSYRIVTPRMAQAENLEKVKPFHFVPTRFLETEDLQRLGVHEEVERLITGIGWQGVASIAEVAYREPTLEFISSFRLVEDTDEDPPFSVMYRLRNDDYELSLAEFNVALSFETEEGVETDAYRHALRSSSPDYDEGAFWLELTGSAHYSPRQSKATAIRDPAMRIFHRWLSMGLFGRRDSTGNVARHQLFVMWAAHHQRRVDAAFQLLTSARGVVSVRQKAGNKGYICIGSYFTALCRYHGIDLDTCTIIKRMKPLGMSTFISMQLVVRADDGTFLLAPPPPPQQPQQPPPLQVAPQPPPPQAERPADPETHQEARPDGMAVDPQVDWQPPPPPPPPPADFTERLAQLQLRLDQMAESQDTQFALLTSRLDAQDQMLASRLDAQDQTLDTILRLLQPQPPPT